VSTTGAGPSGGESTSFHDVEVKFDTSRGYPTSYNEYARTTLNTNELTWRSKQDSVQVTDFTVIQ
jgi:hypothetical protein